MKKTTVGITLVILVSVIIAGCGREQASRKDLTAKELQQLMGPMMNTVTSTTLETTLRTMAKPENAELAATYTRNYYDALLRQGFTPIQALEIVTAAPLPAMHQ